MDHLRQYFMKWFVKQREIILPVPVAIAKQRLQLAFASPITISKGFLYETQKYTGQINDGNEIDVQITISGRTRMRYSMHGQLSPHPKGSRIVMMVRGESSLLLILAIILVMFFVAYIRGGPSIVLAIVFPPLLIIVIIWHLNSAADSISELIYKIVSNQV